VDSKGKRQNSMAQFDKNMVGRKLNNLKQFTSNDGTMDEIIHVKNTRIGF
jgi:hypothetical protein